MARYQILSSQPVLAPNQPVGAVVELDGLDEGRQFLLDGELARGRVAIFEEPSGAKQQTRKPKADQAAPSEPDEE